VDAGRSSIGATGGCGCEPTFVAANTPPAAMAPIKRPTKNLFIHLDGLPRR
jgi:hypothetical protein